LFGAPALLRAAGKGVLRRDEIDLLYRPRSGSLAEVIFTAADVALIDEARTVLGPRRPQRTTRGRAANDSRSGEDAGSLSALLPPPMEPVHSAPADPDEIRAYGHIVVDEVQDLSPMQLRMLARRSISGSMTVVGDIAQATGPWAPDQWSQITRHLAPDRPSRMVELTVSYRTPAEVVRIAARVLAAANPDIAPPTPVRASGFAPDITEVGRDELGAEVAMVVSRELAAVGPGRTAVLAPAGLLGEVTRHLAARGLDPVDPRRPGGPGLSAPLVVLPADEANGLEFDSVVVVEPALVANDGGGSYSDDGPDGTPRPAAPTVRGLRALYVALTRPTRRLSVVHSVALPVDLAPDEPAFAG
jgi:hypothetical protein